MPEKKCAMDTKDLVYLLADLAEQIAAVIGDKGTISTFRYAGKQLGKRLGSPHAGGSEDIARQLVGKFFQDKEFMDNVELVGDAATLFGCRIGVVLKERGIEAGKHALCNFGYGLIDGAIESVTGRKVITLHVSSEYHAEGVTCKETW